jgi:hypothetical protein
VKGYLRSQHGFLSPQRIKTRRQNAIAAQDKDMRRELRGGKASFLPIRMTMTCHLFPENLILFPLWPFDFLTPPRVDETWSTLPIVCVFRPEVFRRPGESVKKL